MRQLNKLALAGIVASGSLLMMAPQEAQAGFSEAFGIAESIDFSLGLYDTTNTTLLQDLVDGSDIDLTQTTDLNGLGPNASALSFLCNDNQQISGGFTDGPSSSFALAAFDCSSGSGADGEVTNGFVLADGDNENSINQSDLEAFTSNFNATVGQVVRLDTDVYFQAFAEVSNFLEGDVKDAQSDFTSTFQIIDQATNLPVFTGDIFLGTASVDNENDIDQFVICSTSVSNPLSVPCAAGPGVVVIPTVDVDFVVPFTGAFQAQLITRVNSSGENVQANIPEPSSVVSFLGLLGFGALVLRRKK
jgi:hypothetical protein